MARTPEQEGSYGNEPQNPEQPSITNHLWPISEAFLASLPTDLYTLSTEDIDVPQHSWETLALFLKNLKRAVEENPHISPDVRIPSSTTIEGPVIIAEGARIEPNAVIIGPTWIDSNATVHAFSRVRESYLGEGVRTGAYTGLNRCVVGSGSRFHRSDFEDSIFGLRVTIGLNSHGFNTAGRGNVRSLSIAGTDKIDTGLAHLGQVIGDKSFIAGDCTLQPGTKVGENVTFKSSGIILYTDVKDNMAVSLASQSRQQLKVEHK